MLQERAGSHESIPMKDVNISAFSNSKRVGKPNPKEFIRKYTGKGGTLVRST